MKKRKIVKKLDERGQQILGMSFGFIFSIFLIVFFILIAFIVIKQFLSAKDCTLLGIFLDSFKADIKKSWNSQIDSHTFRGNLPTKITHVCFTDLTKPIKGNFVDIGHSLTVYEGKEINTFFYPTGKACEIPAHNVPHLDIETITKTHNPFCINVVKGTIFIEVEKELNDPLVKVSYA